MTTAHTQAALRGALDCFDGKAVSLLSEAAVQWSDAPDYLDSLIALCGDDAPMVQSGASWLLLDHARQGGRLTEARLAALGTRLGGLQDWSGVLHVLQLLEYQPVPPDDVSPFADLARQHLDHDRPFLRAWSVSALCRLATRHPHLLAEAEAAHRAALDDPAASVRARARKCAVPSPSNQQETAP